MAGGAVYFVSDTHLGDGTGADRFLYPHQLMDLLNRINEDPHAELVLLGDFMELWSATLESVLVKHAPVFAMLGKIASRHQITYVVGNHDCVPWYYFVDQQAGSIRIAERFTTARGALTAIHGHQYDPFNAVKVTEGNVKVPWTRRLVKTIGFLERFGSVETADAITEAGDFLEHKLALLDSQLPDVDPIARQNLGRFLKYTQTVARGESPGERGYPPGEKAYEEAAMRFFRNGATFVVMGHTHHPLVHKYGNRVYVNSGSWVWDRYPPTYARFADGCLDLYNANTHQPYEPSHE